MQGLSINQRYRLRRWPRTGLPVRWGGYAIWLAMAGALQAQELPSGQPPKAGSAQDASAVPLNPSSVDSEGPAAFKKMSLEELMDQQVTSVSKEPEPLGQAPAAIQIITHHQIRRPGASSLPGA